MSLPPPVPGSQGRPSPFPTPNQTPPGWAMPPPYRPSVKARPGWGWYLAIGGFVVAMGIVAVVVLIVSIVGYVGDLHRIDPGTQRTIELDEGGYTVYLDGRRASGPPSPLQIIDPDGGVVVLEDYDGSHTFESGDREGRAFRTFHAAQDGEYVISLGGGEPSTDGAAVYIGPGFARHVGSSIRRAVVVGLIGLIVGVAATIALTVARGKSRRRQLAEQGL